MAYIKKQVLAGKRPGRGHAMVINAEKYVTRQGLITSTGPWALFPHAEEETFWPGVDQAAPVKIFNGDGTLRETISAKEFRERRENGHVPSQHKPKRSANGKFR